MSGGKLLLALVLYLNGSKIRLAFSSWPKGDYFNPQVSRSHLRKEDVRGWERVAKSVVFIGKVKAFSEDP